jgi:hypothetical protein
MHHLLNLLVGVCVGYAMYVFLGSWCEQDSGITLNTQQNFLSCCGTLRLHGKLAEFLIFSIKDSNFVLEVILDRMLLLAGFRRKGLFLLMIEYYNSSQA